jgi:hypothetical protein
LATGPRGDAGIQDLACRDVAEHDKQRGRWSRAVGIPTHGVEQVTTEAADRLALQPLWFTLRERGKARQQCGHEGPEQARRSHSRRVSSGSVRGPPTRAARAAATGATALLIPDRAANCACGARRPWDPIEAARSVSCRSSRGAHCWRRSQER